MTLKESTLQQWLVRGCGNFVVAGLLLAGPTAAQTMRSVRSVAGTVTDEHHQPVKGAVVQLEDEESHRIVTYLSDADGHYEFKRFAADGDFRIAAEFHGHRSKWKELSRFSSKDAMFVPIHLDLD